MKKLLTAFAFGALIAGVAGFVTSPAFAADTGSSTGSAGTEPGTTTPKKHHKKSSHHHKKKSTESGTSSGTTGGTMGGTAPTTPSK